MSKARSHATAEVRRQEAAQAVAALGLSPERAKDRLCIACQEFRPPANFEMWPLDKRCNICVPPSQAKLIVGEPAEALKYHMNKLFAGVQSQHGVAPARLETLLGQLFLELGGVENVVQMMAKNVRDVLQEGAGGVPQAIKTMFGLLSLLRDVDKHRLEQDVKLMTDEQLREQVVQGAYEEFARMIGAGSADAVEKAATLRAIADQLDPEHSVISAVPTEGGAA